jgi:Membrane-bound lytic murein transglycosylase
MGAPEVVGAGFFPLTAGYSVAVDPQYIPLGATLLAELPDVDEKGRLRGYTYRILFAQDRGDQAYRYRRPRGGARYQLLFPLVRVNFELGVIMVIAVSCVKLLSAHNSTQHTSRKHKV